MVQFLTTLLAYNGFLCGSLQHINVYLVVDVITLKQKDQWCHFLLNWQKDIINQQLDSVSIGCWFTIIKSS